MDNERPRHITQTFFHRAQHPVIMGGHFSAANTVNHFQNGRDGFELLQEHVATTAFHDSAQRVDPPRCHENTRQAVLQAIFDWIIQDEGRTAWIAWLHGAAGAGKSAICQSMAEMCIAHAILVASFFFFRTDPSRCTVDPLVATLAYQLILLMPDAKRIVCNVIEQNPLIFQQSFETQLHQLIIQPLRQIKLYRPMLKLLLIIDGVDECTGRDNQTNVIRTLAKFVDMKDSPIIVLFGSRAENQLQAVFRSRTVSRALLQLPLDNRYLPDIDIRLFLADKFAEIKETHPFGYLLAPEWPVPDHIQEIVAKSSGQFIYASVVMNFISLPHAFPSTQLEIVRGLHPSGLETPFAQLDALYRHIFSTVRDIQAVTTILAYTIITKVTLKQLISLFLQVPEEDLIAMCSDLASVMLWEKDSISNDFNLQFLHASLLDFLLDQQRAQEYYINPTVWSTRLSILGLKAVAPNTRGLYHYPVMCEGSLLTVLGNAECTSELQTSILTFNPYNGRPSFLLHFLNIMKKLDFRDGGEAYSHQLNMATRYIVKEHPQYLEDLKKKHDKRKSWPSYDRSGSRASEGLGV